ncbi:MAG: hypothetical protein K8Q99_06900 [Acholeplasmataceae bacterium]|nr:hypothetical protein [Acholeplasmataceae bacterium]
MKRVMIVLNIIFLTLMTVFTFKVFDGQAEVSVITSAVLLYLVEAVIFLFSLLYVSDHIKEIIIKVLKIYVIIVFSVLFLIFLVEIIFGRKFILYFSYRFIIYAFLIYPLILRVFLKVSAHYVFKDQILVTIVTSFIVVSIMFVHGIFVGLSLQNVSIVKFDDADVEFVLVEQDMIFGSNHSLYLKENALFSSKRIYTWSCESCFVGNGDQFEWTWIDENTGMISGNGLEQELIVEIN